MTGHIFHLENRQLFRLSGSDRLKFLQGLVTNNVNRIADGGLLYTALLTPQGKYLFDFFLHAAGDILYLDCDSRQADDLFRKLMMYKLRSDVEIAKADDVMVLSCEDAPEGAICSHTDPRLDAMGQRALVTALPEGTISPGSRDYHQKRLELAIAEGPDDFLTDKSLALEGNMEELHGVDFSKGCYVGQEITARTKHRGKIRRRFVPVDVEGSLPESDTAILNEDGREIGIIRSGLEGRAMAYMKLEELRFGNSYACGESKITPWKPDWMRSDPGD